MKRDCQVAIAPLTRVEGHGNIRIRIEQGRLLEARWEVVETPRFFEAMLKGKTWENAPWITGRICGICSIGHTLASIRAVERAFGIEPGPCTTRLRLLLKHMETLQSHSLHLFFLVLPDLLGVGSVLPLLETHRETVLLASRIKKLANDACDLVGGRRLHPTRTVVGGFTLYPQPAELAALRERLQAVLPDLDEAAALFGSLPLPDFQRPTEFVSLAGTDAYPFIGGEVVSTDGVRQTEDGYRALTNEYLVPRSTAKWCRLSRSSFAVGALARFNNNAHLLAPAARALAAGLGLAPVCHNPFANNLAQLVECVHVVHDAITLIDELLAGDLEPDRQPVRPRAGLGVAAVEVPRGILYHAYQLSDSGRIMACDCVIPTGQNHANIQADLTALAADFARRGHGDQDLELLAAMLVRAYDPCISCSVH
ncbi:MAG: Ni/Fe hydrogenase subunit alpha [Thermodesulfobacteriota bacterium]